MKEDTMFEVYRLHQSLYLTAARMEWERSELEREAERARAEAPADLPAPAPHPVWRATARLAGWLRDLFTLPEPSGTAQTYWPPEI